jgi:hypothetical protein
MLESWFFHKKDVLIKTIKLIFLITNLHYEGLERSIKDLGAKSKTLFDVLERVLALHMKVCHFGMFK